MSQIDSPYRDPRDAEIETLRERVSDYEKRLGIVSEEIKVLTPITALALTGDIKEKIRARQKFMDDEYKLIIEQVKNKKRADKLRVKKLKRQIGSHLRKLCIVLKSLQITLKNDEFVFLYLPAGLVDDKGCRDFELWRNHGVILYRRCLMVDSCGYIDAPWPWGDLCRRELFEYVYKRNVEPDEFFRTVEKNIDEFFADKE